MNEVFADTSGWASAFVRTEIYHSLAAAFLREWQADGTKVVTTNYVVNEVSALLTSPLRVPRPQQIAILNSIRNAFWVEIVHVDPAWMKRLMPSFRTDRTNSGASWIAPVLLSCSSVASPWHSPMTITLSRLGWCVC